MTIYVLSLCSHLRYNLQTDMLEPEGIKSTGWFRDYDKMTKYIELHLSNLYDGEHEFILVEQKEEGIGPCKKQWTYQYNKNTKQYLLEKEN